MMINLPGKPPAVSWVIPYLVVEDVTRALDLYEKAFGFEIVDAMKNDQGVTVHAEFKYQDITMMCGAESPDYPHMITPVHGKFHTPVALYVYCENVNALYEHVKKFSLKIEHEIHDAFWGDRMFAVLDHDGHQWTFATHLGA